MTNITVPTQPIAGQKPGTSGLRKKTRIFMQPGYLENYVQSIFNGIEGVAGKSLVVGGDGRYFNDRAIQTITKMALANGVAKLIIGQNGLLSTPAASHLIRKHGTDGGLILSASHNPGGIDADFGLKYNSANGGPAAEDITDKIYDFTTKLTSYDIADIADIDLSEIGETTISGMRVQIVDPVEDYAALMETLFDFNAIRDLFQSGFTLKFDAMHAITGPYGTEILERRLGAPKGTVINATPLPDFGKGHPDPNPIWAKPLVDMVMAPDGPDFAAASDGDGDRNMILGRNVYVSPSDSLAVLAANAHLTPAFADGLPGVARSMPTSCAVDRVAEAKGIASFATPTGWKYFGSLLDDGQVGLCGEESAGTGSGHVREKDGLWAVLLWLNILAVNKKSVQDTLSDHWKEYGRNYYSRHDFEAVESDKANAMMDHIRANLGSMSGQTYGPLRVERADEFAYTDPVNGATASQQGLRIFFDGGARAVFRLSGTGTEGATIRLYLEQLETRPDALHKDAQDALSDVIAAALELSDLVALTGRTTPDVIT